MNAPDSQSKSIQELAAVLKPTPWDELDERTRDRVQELIGSMSELEAAMQHMAQLEARLPSRLHPLGRFMGNGLTSYLHGFYIGGGRGVQDVLRATGLEELAVIIDDLLQRQVGELTFGRMTSETRNVLLAHPSFDSQEVLRRVFDKANLDDEHVLEGQFRPSLYSLLDVTRITHVLLRRAYPIAAAGEDARWKPGFDTSS